MAAAHAERNVAARPADIVSSCPPHCNRYQNALWSRICSTSPAQMRVYSPAPPAQRASFARSDSCASCAGAEHLAPGCRCSALATGRAAESRGEPSASCQAPSAGEVVPLSTFLLGVPLRDKPRQGLGLPEAARARAVSLRRVAAGWLRLPACSLLLDAARCSLLAAPRCSSSLLDARFSSAEFPALDLVVGS